MKKHGVLSMILVIAMLMCACGVNGANPTRTEAASPPPDAIDPTTITMLVYSDRIGETYQELMDHLAETVNDKLAKYGYFVRLEIVTRSQGEVRDTGKPGAPYTEAVLEYDLFYENTALNTQYSQLETLAASGMAADITELVSQHEDLFNAYLPAFWREVTIGGSIYAIPLGSSGVSEGTYESGILIRSDIVEALSAEMPETIDELLALCGLAKEAGMDYELAFDAIYPPWAFHRTYDEWPFFVDYESLFVMYPDGTMEAYPYSDIFRQDAENLSKFSGVSRPLGAAGAIASAEASWDFLAALPSVKYSDSTPFAEYIELIQFAPEKPSFSMRTYCDARIYVANKSDNKDAAITLLEAIYTNQEIYDAFLYGEEGEDWLLHDDGTRETIVDMNNVLAHYGLNRSTFGSSDVQSLLSIPAQKDTVIDFPAAGFIFRPSDPVILQAVQQKYYPSQQNKYAVYQLRFDLADVSSSKTEIDLMLKGFEGTGFDLLLDEAKEQYEMFIR